MNKIILLSMFLSSFNLLAQDYYPNLLKTPETGFTQMQKENPYVLSLAPSGNDWAPLMRDINEKAPNANYPGLSIYSVWENEAWIDRTMITDSFVLDDQNRLKEVYNKTIYNFPGLENKYKTKYAYYYNTSNQLERFEVLTTSNFTSNTYKKSSVSFYKYDANGKRMLDSNIYYYSGSTRTSVSYYAYTGQHISSITEMQGHDTLRAFYNTFDGDKITIATALNFDAETDEWTLIFADTFVYNTMGNVIRRASLGYVSRNGVLSIEPTRNDTYKYTAGGRLEEEIERQWDKGVWKPTNKRVFTYDANNKPVEGYKYNWSTNDWTTEPNLKYLFSVQTGLKASNNPLSGVKLSPNPANNMVTINLDKHKASIKLFDITGKCMYEQAETSGELQIDLSAFQNGIYYLMTTSGERQYTQKLMVVH